MTSATAIRPYPAQYVSRFKLRGGATVTIRPIRPEDEPDGALSPDPFRRQRLSPLFSRVEAEERVAHERLARICFIDYDREMALVVEQKLPSSAVPAILGVARLTKLHGTESAEFAMLISDAWQGHGLGTNLLQTLVRVAVMAYQTDLCRHPAGKLRHAARVHETRIHTQA